MSQYNFGVGNMFGTPVGGGAPVKFGALQSVSIDFSADIKELYGQNQFPLALARGKAKIEGKAMFADINPTLYNNLFFAQTLTTGSILQPVNGEAGTIGSSPYTYTVVNTGAGVFNMDLGVFYTATGLPLTQVASAPAAGQYTVSTAGVYTFAAADTGKAILVSYLWTNASATRGTSLAIGNPLMGQAPTWQLVLEETFGTPTQTIVLILYSCTSNKFSLPFKQDDFTVAEIDFQAQTNAAGAVGSISQTN